MLVEVHRHRVEDQPLDPRLLGRLAQRGRRQRDVTGFAVAAELEPRPALACSVSSTCRWSAETTSAPVVRWSGRHWRYVASACASRCSTYRCRSASCPASGADPAAEQAQRRGVETHSSGSVGASSGPSSSLRSSASKSSSLSDSGARGALAEAERVVEVGRRRQQVGVHPHAVAGLDALPGPQRAPQRRGVAEPARPQLQADQGREGLLGRTAGGAAAADRLLQLRGVGHPPLGGLADDLVDPALDERERHLEPLQRGLLGGGVGQLEHAALEQLLHRLGVRRVDAAHLLLDALLDALDVDLDALGVRRHRADQVVAQPRDAGEQPLVRGLAQREVEEDVVLGDVEPLGEGRDVGRDEGGLARGRQRDADVGDARAPRRPACRARSRPGWRAARRSRGRGCRGSARPAPGPPRAAPSPARRPTGGRPARRAPSRRRWC